LYAAKRRSTCLLEVLSDLRPDAKAQDDFQSRFDNSDYFLTGKVGRDWLTERVLARGKLRVQMGQLVDVEDLHLRMHLEAEHAGLLAKYGFKHLDISVLRGPCREVTQVIGRSLYDGLNAAALLYNSNVNNQRCIALFEGRAWLEDTEAVIPLLEYSALDRVLGKLGLRRSPF